MNYHCSGLKTLQNFSVFRVQKQGPALAEFHTLSIIQRMKVRPMIAFNKTLLAAAIATVSLTTPLSFAETFNVTESIDDGQATTEQTLSWAIRQANLLAGADTIDLQTPVTLSGVSFALIDSDITIQGNTNSISGDDKFRPLFVKSGTVTLKDLTIKNGLAQGAGSQNGGSGAGLGGGLFIYGGDVTVQNTTFQDNQAKGGEASNSITRRGGGGMQQTESQASDNKRATSLFGNAEYGHNDTVASGNYGGGAGLSWIYGPPEVLATNGGFGGAGGSGGTQGNAGDGGFGAGGGYTEEGVTGAGGFGGGGAAGGGYSNAGAAGGFGAGGGNSEDANSKGASGFGASKAEGGTGGNGGGMGGAVFVRSGTLSIASTSFEGNSALRGGEANDDSTLEAKGYGGAIFVLHTLENTNGNNQAMPTALPTVSACDVTFGTSAASTANSADSDYNENTSNDIFDPASKFSVDPFTINNADLAETSIKQGASVDISLSLDNSCDTSNSFIWSISQQAGKGVASIANATGTTQTLTYQAADSDTGSDSVIVSIEDASGTVRTQTVSFDITVDTTDTPDTPDTPSSSGGSSGGALYWLLLLTPALLRFRNKFKKAATT